MTVGGAPPTSAFAVLMIMRENLLRPDNGLQSAGARELVAFDLEGAHPDTEVTIDFK